MTTSWIGRKLGKYQVVELLARGGMATVYKGYQEDIDRYVAIKVLPPHPGQDEAYITRFRQEARTIARLQHPNIISVYDYGDEDGALFLVSPLLEGGSLSGRIRRGALSAVETEAMLRQIGQALDYAHRNGVVHRDIKPDNILLDREGHALLTDFGISKIMSGTAGITATGGLVGTPAYMSPEQGQGLPVDYRTDLYSLGVVVYEMLTGKQPYDADTPMQIVFKHISSPVPRLSEVIPNASPELDQVMQQALAKEPERRFQSAFQMVEAFTRTLLDHEPLTQTAAAPDTRGDLNTRTVTPTPESLQPIPTARMQDTMVAHPSTNPVLLLGGFAIIAILIVVVLVLLLNRPVAPGAAEATFTTAPTQVVAAQPTVPAVQTFGRASFNDNVAPGDTIQLRVEGVTPPASGQNYVAWLQNTETEDFMLLGTVLVDALGSGQLSFTDPDGAMLPSEYNAVLLTLEADDTDEPTGEVIYSGSVPREVTAALRAILVEISIEASDGKPAYSGSLYDGVMGEAEIGESHSGLAASAGNLGGMHTHSEHTINILDGTQVDYDGTGGGQNPGRGYGVDFFLDRIAEDLDAAANAPDATRLVQSQIELIRVCIDNARMWKDQIIEIENEAVTATDLESVQPSLVEAHQLAGALLNGVDLNGNGQVEPFEGECGLQQISTYGISVGNIDIAAGALR